MVKLLGKEICTVPTSSDLLRDNIYRTERARLVRMREGAHVFSFICAGTAGIIVLRE